MRTKRISCTPIGQFTKGGYYEKLLSVFLALVLLTTVAHPVLATGITDGSVVESGNVLLEPELNENQAEYITVKECYIAGTKWLQANYDDGTIIESIQPIYNLDDTFADLQNGVEYYINGNTPYSASVTSFLSNTWSAFKNGLDSGICAV